MLELLKNYKKPLKVNDVLYQDIREATEAFQNFSGILHIELNFNEQAAHNGSQRVAPVIDFPGTYQVKVRQYMTKPFGFHDTWNDSKPMPMRVMFGTVEKETPGMYFMKLHGRVMTNATTCMNCGRRLTHPVSKYFGIGPECGRHGYNNPFENEDELKAAVKEVDKKLREIKWDGWVVKKAIEEWVEVE